MSVDPKTLPVGSEAVMSVVSLSLTLCWGKERGIRGVDYNMVPNIVPGQANRKLNHIRTCCDFCDAVML